MTDMSESVARGPRAGFWQRFGAAVIDAIIVGVVILILWAVLKGVGYALGVLISIAYVVYFEGGPTGQTIGKRMLGIRVYDFGGSGGPIRQGPPVIRRVRPHNPGIPLLP